MSEEQSETGEPIHRHNSREEEWISPDMSGNSIEPISDHIEKHIGKIGRVFHEIRSHLIHVDIHIVFPTEERPYYTLITSGMSDLPMSAPKGREEFGFAELMLCLPASWPLQQEDWKKEENYWPIRLLKVLARFPHDYKTWLWYGHTMLNGDPPKPYASNTKANSMILSLPATLSTEFWKLPVTQDKTIYFFSVLPLLPDEVELKLKKGADDLIERFEKSKYSELLDLSRKSVATNPWWNPF